MRARAIVMVILLLLVAGFVTLNWSEFVRPTPLSFGGAIMDAPLGLIMLAALAAVVVLFLVLGAVERTGHAVESRRNYRSLEQQRDLADRAEASRFTDLRTYIDQQLRELRDRDGVLRTEYEKSQLASHRDLRTAMDNMNRSLLSRLDAIEDRIEGRPARVASATDLRRDLRTEEALRNDPLGNPLRADPTPPEHVGRERI